MKWEEYRDGKDIIWVTGAPKCGNTWLARLLGEALDSPIGGPADTVTETYRKPPGYYEGPERTGPFWIFQEHLTEVPKFDAHKVAMIVRDPRDVAVSAFYYWKMDSLEGAVDRLITGKWPYCYRWKRMAEYWIMNQNADAWIRYEDLHKNCTGSLWSVLNEQLNINVSWDKCAEAAEIHEYKRRRTFAEQYGNTLHLGREHQLNMMRKGIVGDWKNHFTPEIARKIHLEFYEWMKWLGYEDDIDWWQKEWVNSDE